MSELGTIGTDKLFEHFLDGLLRSVSRLKLLGIVLVDLAFNLRGIHCLVVTGLER